MGTMIFVWKLNRTRKKWSLLSCFILTSLLLIDSISCIPIDNSLSDDPAVTCGVDSLSIDLQTKKSFTGRIFVKGFSQDRNCQLMADGKSKVMGFSINFESCGLRRNREMNGVSISTTVVVSFHPIFITKIDRAYRLNCYYQEARRSVSQQLDVSMLTTQTIYKQTNMPVCRYDILSEGASGPPVKYAKIGDLVYHKWSCETDIANLYCMKVHSCTVNDGQAESWFMYSTKWVVNDLSAGQTAYVFKFADKPTLHFNCQIELTLRDQHTGCTYSQPQCERGSEGSYADGPPSAPPKPEQYISSQQPPLDEYPTPTPLPNNNNGYNTWQGLSSSYNLNRASGIAHQPLPGAQYRIADNRSTSAAPPASYVAGTPPNYNEAVKYADGSAVANGSTQTQVFPSNKVIEGVSYEEQAVTGSPYASDNLSPSKTTEVDVAYQDERDAFAMNAPTTVDYRSSNNAGGKKRIIKRAKISKKVADFDLPEQSLVVIEIDENPLAQKLLNTKSRWEKTGSASTNCVSLPLFVVVSTLAILLAVLFVIFFVFLIRADRRFISNFGMEANSRKFSQI
uniref:ZP domain-containing protein n=1 Tax=Ditylenchus dipsaci TaxID=166011 RepID=A0A915DT32_9BILA